MTPTKPAGHEPDQFAPRDRNGKPERCARVWVPDVSEERGGHWTPQCPNIVETYSDFEGERYRCSVCGYSYYLDYEDMK